MKLKLVLNSLWDKAMPAFFSAGLAMGMAFGGAGLAQAQQAALVDVDAVIVEPLAQTLPVIGRLVAQQKADVAALVEGPVAKVEVQIGDRVEKGDVLLRLNANRIRQNRNLYAALTKQAEANLRAARNAEELTAQELERLKRLETSAAFSPARLEDKRLELEKQRSQVAVSEAALAAASVNLSLAEIDLARTEIKAPFNGVVIDKFTEVGSYVNKGQAILSLINYEDLEVEADIPSNRLSGLDVGRLVHVNLSSDLQYEAAVRAVIPEENVLTRTRAVRFTMAVPQADLTKLANGQSATVYIPIGATRDVLSVHKDALIAKPDGYSAFVISQGKAEIRLVQVGDAVGNRFEVLSGLKAGDLVVTRGNERLNAGQSVTYSGMEKTGEPTTEGSGS